jgi:hypothetical protein
MVWDLSSKLYGFLNRRISMNPLSNLLLTLYLYIANNSAYFRID